MARGKPASRTKAKPKATAGEGVGDDPDDVDTPAATDGVPLDWKRRTVRPTEQFGEEHAASTAAKRLKPPAKKPSPVGTTAAAEADAAAAVDAGAAAAAEDAAPKSLVPCDTAGMSDAAKETVKKFQDALEENAPTLADIGGNWTVCFGDIDGGERMFRVLEAKLDCSPAGSDARFKIEADGRAWKRGSVGNQKVCLRPDAATVELLDSISHTILHALPTPVIANFVDCATARMTKPGARAENHLVDVIRMKSIGEGMESKCRRQEQINRMRTYTSPTTFRADNQGGAVPNIDIVVRTHAPETVYLAADGSIDGGMDYMDGDEKLYELLITPYSVCMNIPTENRCNVRFDNDKKAYETPFVFHPKTMWQLSVRFVAVMVKTHEARSQAGFASPDKSTAEYASLFSPSTQGAGASAADAGMGAGVWD